MAAMDANEIQRQSRNGVRKGSIMEIDHARALCRVSVGGGEDEGGEGLQTDWIPWFSPCAGTTREWLPPVEGEQVMLLCPMGDPAQGVALRGFFSDAFPAPDNSPDMHTRVYPDGARISYDHAAHALNATLPDGATMLIVAMGSATVKSKLVTLDAEDAVCTGKLTVKSLFTFEAGMSGSGKAGGSGKTMRIAGDADFDGEVKSKGTSLPHHRHDDDGAGEPI